MSTDLIVKVAELEDKINRCNLVMEKYKALYDKVRKGHKEAKEHGDKEAEAVSEGQMRIMRKMIAELHQALDRDPFETL